MMLDPPLNLQVMAPTLVRKRLKVLRSLMTKRG
jgi:hypothetical protein